MKQINKWNDSKLYLEFNLNTDVDKILDFLKKKPNKFHSFKNISDSLHLKISGANFRNIIKTLRLKQYPIIASVKGYCFTDDQSKINEYVIDRNKEIKAELNNLKQLLSSEQQLLILINSTLNNINEITNISFFNKKPIGGFWKYLIYDLKKQNIISSRRKLCKNVLHVTSGTFSLYEQKLYLNKSYNHWSSTINYFKKILYYLKESNKEQLVKHYISVFMEYLIYDLLT